MERGGAVGKALSPCVLRTELGKNLKDSKVGCGAWKLQRKQDEGKPERTAGLRLWKERLSFEEGHLWPPDLIPAGDGLPKRRGFWIKMCGCLGAGGNGDQHAWGGAGVKVRLCTHDTGLSLFTGHYW